MNEVGSGIVSHAAPAEPERGIAKVSRGHARNAYVYGHRLHMQAVPGHGVSMGAQILVGAGGPVAADNVDFGVRASEGNHQVAEQVQQAGIVSMNFSGSIVAQILIDPRLGTGVVILAVTIHEVEPFPGVDMKEAQPVRARVWEGWTRACAGQRAKGTNDKKNHMLEMGSTQ